MSEQIDDGGPAFPGGSYPEHPHAPNGMTLRDYFAAKAMQGICAHPDNWELLGANMANEAYIIADQMLAARDTDTTER
ncbi:MAG: hypothetical protein Q7Q73_09230 [Verrucomicrobiota bacterium JB024]|nr:hypothetical protein [Verrucomicrobiota bacterium JB024]